MEIREPEIEDVAGISDCIRSSSDSSQMTDGSLAGEEDWNALSGPDEIQARVRSSELGLVAWMDGVIVGYIAYKRGNHLSLLFVRKKYQDRGVGRRLLEETLCQFPDVTVNSSDGAVRFYEKMGFSVCGERFLKRGAWSTPMRWKNKAVRVVGVTDCVR